MNAIPTYAVAPPDPEVAGWHVVRTPLGDLRAYWFPEVACWHLANGDLVPAETAHFLRWVWAHPADDPHPERTPR